MKYKIIADSSCDLSDELKAKLDVELVPLSLQLEDKIYIDDENLDVKQYVNDMKNCPVAPKTACPSPDDFMRRFEGDEASFVVTLSSNLSGTYNSALVAKDLYQEEHPDKFIHVFNSKGASVTETITALKIDELIKEGCSETEIVEKVEDYIKNIKTYFLLESLEHLAKAGRLNTVVAKIASLLKIKPIMGASSEGTIQLVHRVRGYKKAFLKFVDTIGDEVSDFSQRILGIAHCNCYDRAKEFKEKVLEKYNFKDVFIVDMSGLTSSYADNGGLVIAF